MLLVAEWELTSREDDERTALLSTPTAVSILHSAVCSFAITLSEPRCFFHVKNSPRNRARSTLISSLNFPEHFATPSPSILVQCASARVPFQAPSSFTQQFKPKQWTKRFPSSSPRSTAPISQSTPWHTLLVCGSLAKLLRPEKRYVHDLRYFDKYGKFWRYDIS